MGIKIIEKDTDYIKPANDIILDGYKNTQLKIPLQTKDLTLNHLEYEIVNRE